MEGRKEIRNIENAFISQDVAVLKGTASKGCPGLSSHLKQLINVKIFSKGLKSHFQKHSEQQALHQCPSFEPI